ncbi:MAG: hypothetical protein A2788_01395 [Candidatus Abawacabacteria bacterium RIFCSPHIGHO2_01_FULL_46_8]|uniref:Uncharacterized protein n=1 Tax=Candidatus Abawacabacteria bacterium RIFCSPHIGHO2_01_FULL_46_8 TaxID=1817815 RepID=A0A1F4XPV3_9BACT|nr:MAG: hypothetical protein A2788_01395 [Candidatus Abawacabacteria bacterium RIFCSPHIGHO2_01_FULL_46_8]
MQHLLAKLKGLLPFGQGRPKIVVFKLSALLMATAIMTLLWIFILALFQWSGSAYGQALRELSDSLLPIFNASFNLSQLLIQSILALIAAAIISAIFVLLYNYILCMLGEED